MRTIGLVLAAVSIALPACATQSVVGKWQWLGIGGAEILEVENSLQYSLEFTQDGRYAVRADCNRGSGSYSMTGHELKLGPAAMTLVACPEDSLADRLLASFTEILTVVREGDQLALLLPGRDARLLFRLARPLVLPGTRWNVRAVNDGKQAVRSVVLGTSLELSFAQGGKASGSAGCNRFFGDYTLSENALQFQAIGSTRMMCARPEGVMQQEAEYLAALATVARFEVDGDHLALRTESGSLAVDLFAGVTGSASCREPCRLPSGAEVEVVLEDVSLADVPAVTLARQRVPAAEGQAPVAFELGYDPTQIDPRHSYSLRARITGVDGELLYTTTQSNPVITRDAPIADVELTLDPLP